SHSHSTARDSSTQLAAAREQTAQRAAEVELWRREYGQWLNETRTTVKATGTELGAPSGDAAVAQGSGSHGIATAGSLSKRGQGQGPSSFLFAFASRLAGHHTGDACSSSEGRTSCRIMRPLPSSSSSSATSSSRHEASSSVSSLGPSAARPRARRAQHPYSSNLGAFPPAAGAFTLSRSSALSGQSAMARAASSQGDSRTPAPIASSAAIVSVNTTVAARVTAVAGTGQGSSSSNNNDKKRRDSSTYIQPDTGSDMQVEMAQIRVRGHASASSLIQCISPSVAESEED
ncbi:hypothetical protein OC834_007196, partial [Tilletia horrida]